jgi:hypothetical protein
MSDNPAVARSIKISREAYAAAEEIMRLGGFPSIAEALRHAIGDEQFIRRKLSNGYTFLTRRGNHYAEILWPSPPNVE